MKKISLLISLLFCLTLSFICYRCASSVKHFQIGWDGTQFKFGMGSFSNISEFVEHFENKPLIGGDSGKLNTFKEIFQ